MIHANIKNYEKYVALNSNFKEAFQFLLREDLDTLQTGKYEIKGSEVFALVQEYETKDLENGKYEAHKNYIDIQYMVKGTEYMGYSPIEQFETLLPYNPEKDVEILRGTAELTQLRAEEFYIFFPEDAHMPGIAYEKRENVRKVVVKVHV